MLQLMLMMYVTWHW